MDINRLIDAAIAKMPNGRVEEFLKEMGISDATMYYWRQGKARPTPDHAVKLAAIAGTDPSKLVLEIMEETAKTDDLRSVIADWKRRLTAAAVALAFVVPALLQGAADCILCKITRRSPLH